MACERCKNDPAPCDNCWSARENPPRNWLTQRERLRELHKHADTLGLILRTPFGAAAHEAVPQLLAEVERLEAENERLRTESEDVNWRERYESLEKRHKRTESRMRSVMQECGPSSEEQALYDQLHWCLHGRYPEQGKPQVRND